MVYGAGLTTGVVPDPVIGQLHGVGVLCLLKVLVRVPTHVTPAPNVPTDETYPKVLHNRRSNTTEVQGRKKGTPRSYFRRSNTADF